MTTYKRITKPLKFLEVPYSVFHIHEIRLGKANKPISGDVNLHRQTFQNGL